MSAIRLLFRIKHKQDYKNAVDCFSVTNILHVSHEEMVAPIQFVLLKLVLICKSCYPHKRHCKHFLRAQALMGGENSDF